MFDINDEKIKVLKLHHVPEEKKMEEKKERRTIAAPVVDGKMHIGSGEDAYVEDIFPTQI